MAALHGRFFTMRPDLLSNIFEVKKYLKETDNTNDVIIELLMNMTLGEIEGFIQRSLKFQRHVETRNYESKIFLRQAPVMGIDSIVAGTTTLTFDDYHIDLQKGILYPFTLGDALTGRNAIRITYDAGYFDARISSRNNKIDFEETTGTELTATVAVGIYNRPQTDAATYIKSPATLLAEAIKTALDAAGASGYTVSYDVFSNRFTILSDLAGGGGVFNLLGQTGTHVNQSILPALGYDITTDKTGAASYESDENDDFAPYDLKGIFLSMCRIAWERYQQDSILAQVTSERIPDGSSINYKYAFDLSEILPIFMRALENYQRIAIG